MELKRQYPRSWWWSSFFLAYVSQHIFLFGITLPLYAAFADPRPISFGIIDAACIVMSLAGIYLAHRADTVLRAFMMDNEAREARGEPKTLLLEQGAWRFSRHPNYVGEQIHWWGLGLLAAHQGYSWMLLGPLLNSICLGVATRMVEERMLRSEARKAAYEGYQRRVDVWIPFSNPAAAAKEMIGALTGAAAPVGQQHRE